MNTLKKRRVLITRSGEDSTEWAAELARHGAEAVSHPCITTELIDTPALREGLARSAAAADWLVFTSRRGVEAYAELNTRVLQPWTRIAAVGSATGQAALARLGRIDHVGQGTAAQLGESLTALGDFTRGSRCLLAVAANASAELEQRLERAGATCTRFDVYRTKPAHERTLKQPLSALRVDTILFASPSAVQGFTNQFNLDTDVRVFTIGPSTTAAARSHGIAVTAESRTPSFEGLLEAMNAE
jgi:uroporphyrinogen III methyltransferase/synthase